MRMFLSPTVVALSDLGVSPAIVVSGALGGSSAIVACVSPRGPIDDACKIDAN